MMGISSEVGEDGGGANQVYGYMVRLGVIFACYFSEALVIMECNSGSKSTQYHMGVALCTCGNTSSMRRVYHMQSFW